MKVLLCQDVEKLGWYGDVVEVKDGYARNYLLPYGVATVPSEGKMKSMAAERAKRAEERKLVLVQLERVAEAVEGAEVVVLLSASISRKLVPTMLRFVSPQV
jgi:large subunit ribosomal protein L9